MKVRDMVGLVVDPRGDLQFDQDECNRYVSRFVAAFKADVDEETKAKLVYEIHTEVCAQYDLYIGINDALGSRYRSALKTYINQWKLRSSEPR